MKLNVYKNQKEVEKTYEADAYDLMYGTVEDILGIFDDVEDLSDNMKLFEVIKKNRNKLDNLILDIFPEMKKEELKRVKVKEFIPLFVELFTYVKDSFGTPKN